MSIKFSIVAKEYQNLNKKKENLKHHIETNNMWIRSLAANQINIKVNC